MARKNGNGKHVGPQLKLLMNIDQKLSDLVEGQKALAEQVGVLAQVQLQLVERIDNMLGFIGDHYKSHDVRLSRLEERLAKAGL